MGAQRELWMRILLSLVITGVSLLGLSWYLERQASAALEEARPQSEKSPPPLEHLDPIPGRRSGLPFRDLSQAETLELVALAPGAQIQDLACILDLRSGRLFLRRPEQAPARIFLRGPPLAGWSPMQRAQLLQAIEGLLEAWDRDLGGLRFPPGEDFRTLRLWIHRTPILLARRLPRGPQP